MKIERGQIIQTGLLLILSLLAALHPWQVAQADTYEVTNTDNSGAGSLRQAITDANNHLGPDTITFASSTNGIPIVLSGAAGEDNNASGDLDILDGGDLTIQGNGVSNTIIDGGGIDRVFHVCPGGGCTNTITLSGVTIQNGSPGFLGGGGIRNAGGTTILDGSTIRDCTASNGGGITNLATMLVQNGSTIGGIGVGNETILNGAGIYNFNGTLTVDDSTISANSASNNGGGIWNQATLIVQNGSTIGRTGVGNTADNDGGGIYNFGVGVVTLDDSRVSANSAVGVGGGIYNAASLIVQNGSIIGSLGAGNTADIEGGGIFNNETGTTTVDGSTVSDNTASEDGGGLANTGTLTIQNGSTIGGVGGGNTANNEGGGIYNIGDGLLTLESSTVSGNLADYGGGIFNYDTGTTIVDNSSVGGNIVARDGGGIYNDATLVIQNASKIGDHNAGNKADLYGGGIHNDTDGTITLDGSTVSNNSASKSGGGIYNYAELYVQNGSTIGGAEGGNTAGDDGGGIYNWGDTLRVTGSSIMNNTASGDGGAVFSRTDIAGGSRVTGSCIVGNSATSFYNSRDAEQIATGNWWGAPAGPNTSGADTTFGNVDVSGYLTEPVQACINYLYLPLVVR